MGDAVDVAIIGAGPAGLTAGYLLTKAGYSVALIEKDPLISMTCRIDPRPAIFKLCSRRIMHKALL